MRPPAIPNLEGLDRLAVREGVDIRPILVRVLTDLYVQRPAHTAEEELHYTELVLRLIDAVDLSTRAIVAKKLATYAAAPAAIVRRLARDELEVAEPVLKHSSRITGPELLAVIQDFGPRYAAVIAARRPPEPVIAASRMADASGRPAAASVAPKRPVPEPARIEIEDTDQGVEAQTDEMAPDMRLGELFFAASSAERRLILTNLDQEVEPPSDMPVPPNEAFARLETAALAQQPEEFIRELEAALGVTPGLARRIVEDATGEPLLVAVKALGMPADILLRILLFLDPAVGQSVPRVFDRAKLYDRFSRRSAARLIASLRDVATRRAPTHQPLLWNDDADRGRRAAGEAARKPAGALPAGRRDLPATPARRQGTT